MSLEPLRRKQLTSSLQQTLTWCKLSPTGCIHLTTVSSMPGYKPSCYSGTKVLIDSDDQINVWCVPSATHVPCTHQHQNKILVIRVFVAMFSEISSYIQFFSKCLKLQSSTTYYVRLRFSQQCGWGFKSSGMWCCVRPHPRRQILNSILFMGWRSVKHNNSKR